MSALINPRYYPMIPNLVSECFVLYSTNFHILSFFVDWATSYMEIVRFKKSLVSPNVSRNLYLKSQAITNRKFDIPFFFLCQRSQKAKKQKSQFLFSFLFSYFWINSPLAGTESAQADPVPAVSPLNTVHCWLYTCAGATRDEYFQLCNTRDEYFH